MRKPTKPGAKKASTPAKKTPATWTKSNTSSTSIDSYGEIRSNGKLVPYSSKLGQQIRRDAQSSAKKEGDETAFERVYNAKPRQLAKPPMPAKATVKKSVPAPPMSKKVAKVAKKMSKKK